MIDNATLRAEFAKAVEAKIAESRRGDTLLKGVKTLLHALTKDASIDFTSITSAADARALVEKFAVKSQADQAGRAQVVRFITEFLAFMPQNTSVSADAKKSRQKDLAWTAHRATPS